MICLRHSDNANGFPRVKGQGYCTCRPDLTDYQRYLLWVTIQNGILLVWMETWLFDDPAHFTFKIQTYIFYSDHTHSSWFLSISDRGNLPKNTGNTLLYQQFKGMVGKRLLSAYRDIGSLSFQLGVPLIFTILAGSLISDYATVDIDDFVDMTAPNPHLALLLGSWAFQSVFTFGYAFLASSFISFLVAERTL